MQMLQITGLSANVVSTKDKTPNTIILKAVIES